MKTSHHKKLGIINFYKEKCNLYYSDLRLKILFSSLLSKTNVTGPVEVSYWVKALASVRTLIQISITYITAGSFYNFNIPTENWKDCVTAPLIFISQIHLKGASGKSKVKKLVRQGPSLVYLPLLKATSPS